jgi:hypothetical protein
MRKMLKKLLERLLGTTPEQVERRRPRWDDKR